ncbi:MAG: hypothetical protein RIT27_1315 [Pseudomonadota bacterium]|jgi:hypothetical protein
MNKLLNFDKLYSNLEQTFIVFKDFILEHNYQKFDSTVISWLNYESGITKNTYYAKEYEELINNRQFSFLLKDRSIIQIYYEFNTKELIKYKLAYYPYPVLTKEDSNQIEDYYCNSYDETLCDLYNVLKESSQLTNTSHLRFDYDHFVTSHATSELQIGAINNIRIPSAILICPFIFVDFIIKNLFSKSLEYKDVTQSKNYKDAHKFSKSCSVKIEKFIDSDICLILLNK